MYIPLNSILSAHQNALLPDHLAALPQPDADAVAHSERLCRLIDAEIGAAGGWLSFARFMELALSAPGLGYYSAGTRKLGAAGDFITAPEMGALFARTLARQALQVLGAGIPDIIEIGPGSGRLACALLTELETLDCLPQRYLLLETSAELRERQQALLHEKLPHLESRIAWLARLPESMHALVIANEVLDVLPAHIVRTSSDGIQELGVTVTPDGYAWCPRPAAGAVLTAARKLQLPPDYTTEINLAAQAFVRTLASRLVHGVALLIDYGFPAHEYYHPQRSAGTLMCHYRHRAHDDPLRLVGLQDITAHVDFSAIAEAALDGDCEVLGYTNQAQFLVNCGITELLAAAPTEDARAYVPLAAEAQQLLSPAQMGELFKVLAIGKNFAQPLIGYASGDKLHTL